MKNRQNLLVFILICTAFLVFSFSIYLYPIQSKPIENQKQIVEVAEGKLIWQKYNCQSCHQIYGLGGYLGPDITNCMSQVGKGEQYVKAMIELGNKQMPAFKLGKEELDKLLIFLKAIDQTGQSDPRKFTTYSNGMIEQNEN